MNKRKEKEFLKRYDKFKNNNLPTPFWDDERQTLEYVYYNDEFSYWDNLFKKNNEYDKLNVTHSITEALGNLTCSGFYYPYSCGACKEKEYQLHNHYFDDVVRDLYDYPESFKISKDNERFYSEQQLDYLKNVQKYLLFMGLKDIDNKRSIKRYRNNRQKKYGSAYIRSLSNQSIKDFISGKRNFIVIITDNIDIYKNYEEYPNHDFKELIVDQDGNFKLFIEYTHSEIKTYKDIKNVYENNNLKDTDQIVAKYFKILELL